MPLMVLIKKKTLILQHLKPKLRVSLRAVMWVWFTHIFEFIKMQLLLIPFP